MKQTRIASVLLLALCFTLAFSSSVFSQERHRYPLMRPDAETLAQWMEDYETAPKAPEAPKRMAGVVMEGDGMYGGSLSLLNNIQYTPSQRNQGSCGNCWAWAGTGVLELALYAQQSIRDRLSVQLLDACYRNNPYPGGAAFCACSGGNLSMFAGFYNSKGYAVPWSNAGAAYADGGGACTGACGDVATTPNYAFSGAVTAQTITTLSVSQDDAIANIKNILNQGKGVWFAYLLAHDAALMGWDDFFDYWYDNGESVLWNPDPYCGVSATTYAGHAVLIVGYDDNDPDPANHYWIVLNSWTTAGGKRPNGLFRMKMRMNYACTLTITGYGTINSRLFQTLNVTFASCSYGLSESGHAHPSTASSGSVNVTAGETCSWVAVSNAPWITVTGGASGTGNGTVNYSVAENKNAKSRSGSLTIAGKTLSVTQAGTPPSVTTKNPSGDASGVSTGTAVRATFSETMKASSFTTSSFMLTRGATPVAGVVSYDALSMTATFTPSSALALGATYTATITTAVQDDEAVALPSPVSWNFTTTGGEPAATNPSNGGGGGCFIATAAFGSPLEPHVQILRDFRDEYLRGCAAGSSMVRLYEDLSPPVARFISTNEVLKAAVRLSLLPLIGLAFVVLQLGAELTMAAGFFSVAFVTVGVSRRRRLQGGASDRS